MTFYHEEAERYRPPVACDSSLHCEWGYILTFKEPCKSCSRRYQSPGRIDSFFPARHFRNEPEGTFAPYREKPYAG
jgi:hypothetical protein